MHAVVIHETGDPEVLHWEEVPDPEPNEGEVLIRVHAAGVNPIDWKYRRGLVERELPTVLGDEGSGIVQTSRADGFAEGDEVFGHTESGGYAELATAPADTIGRKPRALTHEQAATINDSAQTAWQALFDQAGLERGQTVLITGAAGGVGHFAVQFAKRAGARVIGTGGPRNHDFVMSLGADEYVDYSEQEVADAVSEVDVAFDTVGGEVTGSLVPAVRDGGVIVVIASAPPEKAAKARGIRTVLHGTQPNQSDLREIAELIAKGEVRVELSEVIPMNEVQRAHELSESGHVRGKLVLSVPRD
jgi:NADPH:quinone reductase-like Zn-dependent oxidoreductase